MDHGPLVTEEIAAGDEFVRRFDQYKPVKTAFWLKQPDDYRYLYLASDAIDTAGVFPGYHEVVRIASEMDSPWLSPFRVKLIVGDDPLATDACALAAPASGRPVRRYGGTLGDESADDLYVYPALHAVAA